MSNEKVFKVKIFDKDDKELSKEDIIKLYKDFHICKEECLLGILYLIINKGLTADEIKEMYSEMFSN